MTQHVRLTAFCIACRVTEAARLSSTSSPLIRRDRGLECRLHWYPQHLGGKVELPEIQNIHLHSLHLSRGTNQEATKGQPTFVNSLFSFFENFSSNADSFTPLFRIQLHLSSHNTYLQHPDSSKDKFKMCCWPFVDVVLEDPPPKKEEKKEFHLVSDRLNLVGVSQPWSSC